MTASLNGITCTHARVNVPAWGAWFAEVSLDDEHELTGSVSLVVADLTLSCAVLSGGIANGRSPYRLVGGAGKWGNDLPAKFYTDDAGVKASLVLSDAASECGETIDVSNVQTRLGAAFTRAAGPASRVLEQLFPAGWYIDDAGVTRIGARAASTLPAEVVHSTVDLARGTVELASETLAEIHPGLVVDGLTAVAVEHVVTPEGLRSKVWGERGGSSRRLDSMRKIVEGLDPDRKFRSPVEYRVTSLTGDRINAQPVRVSLGMPDVSRVLARPGLPGCKGNAKLGSRVLISFIEADPSRPVVTGYEDAAGSGFVPTTLVIDASSSIKIGADATKGAARDGDDICLGYFVKETTNNTIYRSPPELGPLLTVYTQWQKVSAVADVYWCTAVNPASPTVPPPPGTPGTALMGTIIEASSLVKIE